MKHIIRLYLHISKWSSFEVYSNFHEVEDEDQEEGDVATITGDHTRSQAFQSGLTQFGKGLLYIIDGVGCTGC
jgi:hypothetical protein